MRVVAVSERARLTSWAMRALPAGPNIIMMAVCARCDRHAMQTRISHYFDDILNRGPYLCDECRSETPPIAVAGRRG